MIKDKVLESFNDQLTEKSILTQEKFDSLKTTETFHDCPPLKIGDTVLYFFATEIKYDSTMKKDIKRGDMIGFHEKLNKIPPVSNLVRITKDYLESDECILYKDNVKISSSYTNSKIPMFNIVSEYVV